MIDEPELFCELLNAGYRGIYDTKNKEVTIFDPKHWELIERYAEETRMCKWIPVSERLPDDMQRVLIWFEYYRYGDYNCMYQTYGFGYVCDGKWSPFINGKTGWQDARIIAWMPLPEPYKEVKNDF